MPASKSAWRPLFEGTPWFFVLWCSKLGLRLSPLQTRRLSTNLATRREVTNRTFYHTSQVNVDWFKYRRYPSGLCTDFEARKDNYSAEVFTGLTPYLGSKWWQHYHLLVTNLSKRGKHWVMSKQWKKESADINHCFEQKYIHQPDTYRHCEKNESPSVQQTVLKPKLDQALQSVLLSTYLL